jgi:anti-sigma B factor antagonist
MSASNLAWMDLVEDISPDASGTVAILKLKQDLTFSNLQPFQTFVRARIKDGKTTLKLDFSSVKFIDSAGVGAMAGLHKAAKAEGGELVLLNPNQTVKSILKIVGLDRVIRFEDCDLPRVSRPIAKPVAAQSGEALKQQAAAMHGVQSELSEGEADQETDDAVSRLLLKEMTVQGPAAPTHITPQALTIQLKENVTYRNATMVADGFLSYLRKGVKMLRAEMSRVDFIDSAGVAALMKVARSFSEEGGELVLLEPSVNLQRILKIAKLDRVLRIEQGE